MYSPRTPLQAVLVTAILAVSAAGAGLGYHDSEVHGSGDQILLCDLDGDRLRDIVLMNEPNLLIFYQDPRKGFAQRPDPVYRLDYKPSVVWPARLNKNAESLLVMTSDGVAELGVANRGSPIVRRQIIAQQTIVPESVEGPSITYFPLSPQTKGDAPVILVPLGGDVQVWRSADTWRHVQTLQGALETTISASRGDLGYNRTAGLTMSLGDITADQRDDIIVRTSFMPMCRYAMYTQNPDGLFNAEPALTWAGQWDWSWYCWVDINRDGRVDLIKGSWPHDPYYIPGLLSGKVLVQIHMADDRGRIPAEPQQVFRKTDWIHSVPVVDIDGDGYMDLAMGYSAFNSREALRKTLTAKQIDLKLRFYFYRPGEGFPEEPDCDVDLVIHIDRHSFEMTYPRRRYFETFVNLHGDFDGDGDKDLLVRDRPDRVSVHPFLSRQDGFAKEASLWFSYTDPISHLQAEDLNDDRVSDVIMSLSDKDMLRVFVSHTR